MLCIQTEKISTLWLQKQIWKYAKISNIRMERQELETASQPKGLLRMNL